MAHERNSVERLAASTSEEIEQRISEADEIEQHRKADVQRRQAAEAGFHEQLVAWVESDTAPAHNAAGIRPPGARRESRAPRRHRRVRSKRAGPSSSDESDGDGPGRAGSPARRRIVVDNHYVVVGLVVVA